MNQELSTSPWVVGAENAMFRVKERTPDILRAIEQVARRAISLARTVEPVLRIP